MGHRFLVNLVKLKPERTDEELRSSLTEFTNLVDKCCKAEEPKICFNEEVVTFISTDILWCSYSNKMQWNSPWNSDSSHNVSEADIWGHSCYTDTMQPVTDRVLALSPWWQHGVRKDVRKTWVQMPPVLNWTAVHHLYIRMVGNHCPWIIPLALFCLNHPLS